MGNVRLSFLSGRWFQSWSKRFTQFGLGNRPRRCFCFDVAVELSQVGHFVDIYKSQKKKKKENGRSISAIVSGVLG